MEATDINEEFDLRLEKLIESHVSNLRADFRRLLDDLPVQENPPAEAADGTDHAEALAQLKRSVETIHAADNQREMAYRLLDAAGYQAARAALFLTRGETCVGFEARAFNNQGEPFDQVTVSPAEGDPLRAALVGQETMHIHGSSLAGTSLAPWLGQSEAQQVCLAPVVVGGQTVAVLYADSGESSETGVIHPESIEILTSVAGMYLERLRRPAHTGAESQPATECAADSGPLPQETPPEDPASTCATETVEPEPQEDLPAEIPMGEPLAACDSEATPVATADVQQTMPMGETLPADEPATPTFDATATVALDDTSVFAPEEVTQASDTAAPPMAATLPDLQPEPNITEDAQRFARLLVSEIVLYNEAQVKAGQKNGDLLQRLNEPIQRSRQSYMDRFGAQSISCFDDELVKILAAGDPALLGMSGA